MKKWKVLHWTLAFLPLILTGIALPMLPDQIPAHYGIDGQVNRWGSKYESLFLPLFTILFALVLLLLDRFSRKTQNGAKQNEKVLAISNLVGLGVFNVLNGFILYSSLTKVENINAGNLNMMAVLSMFMGLGMIFLGNYLPKSQQNAAFGIRTTATLSSETVWQQTHRFGGKAFMAFGVLLIVQGVFLKDIWPMILMLVEIILLTIVLVVYAQKLYRAEQAAGKEK